MRPQFAQCALATFGRRTLALAKTFPLRFAIVGRLSSSSVTYLPFEPSTVANPMDLPA